MTLPCLICTQYTVNILQLVSHYALNRMISIITRIHNSTLLYGHILTMISTSTVERLYAQAYIRVYMYAHVTHSACLDFPRAYTIELQFRNAPELRFDRSASNDILLEPIPTRYHLGHRILITRQHCLQRTATRSNFLR
jgi:hypothetical protein